MNTTEKKKILIIAPFWGTPNHVGNYRIERFIRWLNRNDYQIVLLKAGSKKFVVEKDWGFEISLSNKIVQISQYLNKFSEKIKTRFFVRMWHALVHLSSPIDYYFFWSKQIRHSNLINEYIRGVKYVISSSPPFSSQIAAYNISIKYSIPQIVDLRDGWLDEPLVSTWYRTWMRYIVEKRWERKVLFNSVEIFVTSNIWKSLLLSRLPKVGKKITILTNAYPVERFNSKNMITGQSKPIIKLLYTGRFTGSVYLRKPQYILYPLHSVLFKKKIKAELVLLSNLKRKDQRELNYWTVNFKRINSELYIRPQIPREEMFELVNGTDGLLLLSTSIARIPSKTFEYIKSSKPILAVTLKNSAVWQLGKKVPQMFLFDYTAEEEDYLPIIKFLAACSTGKYESNIPEEFSEEYLSKVFMDVVNKTC